MKLYHPHKIFYSNKIIPYLGEKVAKNRSAYAYPVEAIEDFPHNQELDNIAKNGFFCYNRKKYLGGIASF